MKISRLLKTIFMIDFLTGLSIAINKPVTKSTMNIVFKNREIFIYFTGSKSKYSKKLEVKTT